jgi:hypothetical protein
MNTNIKNYERMVRLFGPAPSGRPHSTPHIDAIRKSLIAEGKSAASSKVKAKSSSKGKNKAPTKPVEDYECSDDDDFTPRSLARSNAMFAAWRASPKPVEEENDSDDDFTPKSNARHARLKAQAKGKSKASSRQTFILLVIHYSNVS